MLLELINKTLVILFVLSCLNIIRHGYYLIQAVLTDYDEQPNKYKLKPLSLILFGLSLSYIISSIFIGIQI